MKSIWGRGFNKGNSKKSLVEKGAILWRRMACITLLMFLVLSSIFTSVSHADFSTNVRFRGSVTDNNGVGIPGVIISFKISFGYGNLPTSVITDSEGDWEQTGFSYCEYTITAFKSGVSFHPQEIKQFGAYNSSGLSFTSDTIISTPENTNSNNKTYLSVTDTSTKNNFAIQGDFRIYFSDKIYQGPEYYSIRITSSNNESRNASLDIANNVLIFEHGNIYWCYDTTYTITIPAGAVIDEKGNKLKDTYTVNFKTEKDTSTIISPITQPPVTTPPITPVISAVPVTPVPSVYNPVPSTVTQPINTIPAVNAIQTQGIIISPSDGSHVTEGRINLSWTNNMPPEITSKARSVCLQIFYTNFNDIYEEKRMDASVTNYERLFVKGTYGILIGVYDQNEQLLFSGKSALIVDPNPGKVERSVNLARRDLMLLSQWYPDIFKFNPDKINDDNAFNDYLIEFARIYNLSDKYKILDELYYYLQIAIAGELPLIKVEYRILALRGDNSWTEYGINIGSQTTLKLWSYGNGHKCYEIGNVTYKATTNPDVVKITGNTVFAQPVDKATDVMIDAIVNNKVLASNFNVTVASKKTNKSAPSYTSYKIEMQIGYSDFTVNGIPQKIDPNNSNVVPIIINDRTYVPIRAIIESIGGNVEWDGNNGITLKLGNNTLQMTSDSTSILLNGAYIQNDTPILVKNDRTLVPLRVVLEQFGCVVNWEPSTKKIFISYNLYTLHEDVNSEILGYAAYIFYLPIWENEAIDDRKRLSAFYGLKEEQIILIPVSSADELTNAWNNMGNIDGTKANISAVVIDTHADYSGLKFGNGNVMSLNDIQNLEDKVMGKLILYGCNAGHLDHKGNNPASAFSKKVNGAPVLTSDGNVNNGTPRIFGIAGAFVYESANKEDFRNQRPNNSTRDNEGWIIYRYDDNKINISESKGKKLTLSQMLELLE